MDPRSLTNKAVHIWQQAVDAVRPRDLLRRGFEANAALRQAVEKARRIWVVGAGKAGGAMAQALEEELAAFLPKIEGIVNVPANAVRPLQRIRLHAARPAASNHPTPEGVEGAEAMLRMVAAADADDLVLCLISGGGSALLPAPLHEITLADKQAVTKQLHACGATIHEMNCVRKHLSRIKGGRLAAASRAGAIWSLIISDVVGDPLDVIGSGPTAPDETTFADALNVLEKYQLLRDAPEAVVKVLRAGCAGDIADTPKQLGASVQNCILGNNQLSLQSAADEAAALGFRVLQLGSFIEGETKQVATVVAGIVRSIQQDARPFAAPACILMGGETTVTLTQNPGKGGRNQEFVLAMLEKLGLLGIKNIAFVSGGTDGEDGPTDAAGAFADEAIANMARVRGLSPSDYLSRHDAYHFFAPLDALLLTGLTETNVMDVRVVLIA